MWSLSEGSAAAVGCWGLAGREALQGGGTKGPLTQQAPPPLMTMRSTALQHCESWSITCQLLINSKCS